MIIRNLKQEDMSGRCQIIYIEVYNKFTGGWVPRFETRFYEDVEALEAIQHVFGLTGDDSCNRKYKAIKLLSDERYIGPEIQSALKCRV